jgi:hypothetical protein
MVASKKGAKQSANPKQGPISTPKVTSEVQVSTSQPQCEKHKGKAKTRIVAHYDCGFPNNLFIRGEGISSLSWDKGSVMKNVAPNEWVWESDRPFSTAHFKILINDNHFEAGEDHTLAFGQEIDFSPLF